MENLQCKRGEIYYCDLGTGYGSEQGGNVRPVICVQNNVGNAHSGTTIIAPLTSSKTKKKLPTHVYLKKEENNLDCDSIILLEQVRVIDKSRLKNYVTYLDESKMSAINRALAISCGLMDAKKGEQNGFNRPQFAYQR